MFAVPDVYIDVIGNREAGRRTVDKEIVTASPGLALACPFLKQLLSYCLKLMVTCSSRYFTLGASPMLAK